MNSSEHTTKDVDSYVEIDHLKAQLKAARFTITDQSLVIQQLREQTGLDLPPIKRTEANLWKAKYFQSYAELVKANKGLRRLHQRLSMARHFLRELTKIKKVSDQEKK